MGLRGEDDEAGSRRSTIGAAAAQTELVADLSDQSLVDAARAGPPRDREAHRALYERYAPLVHSVLLARVQPADADDLVHEVFLAAMRELGRVRHAGALGAWLAAIARRKAAGHRRAAGRWRSVAGRIGSRGGGGGAAGGARGLTDEAAAALDAIRALPQAYAETLAMRLVWGLTGPQIAESMGMTHGSVRVNLSKGMAMLRERLGPGLGPPRAEVVP